MGMEQLSVPMSCRPAGPTRAAPRRRLPIVFLGATAAWVAGALAPAPAAASLVIATWTGPAVGTWETAASWSALSVPNNGGPTTYGVIIDGAGGQASSVLLTSVVQVQSVQVNAGDTLRLLSNSQLGLAGGSIANAGLIELAGGESLAAIRCDADLALAGAGVLAGVGDGSNRISGATGAVRLTNASGHSIVGTMLIGANLMRLTNAGLIEASSGLGIQLDLSDSGTNFNTGTMRAANNALLRVLSTTIDNTGGVMEADSGGLLGITNSTIKGGTLRDADGDGPASVQNLGLAWLDGVAIEGTFVAPATTSTFMRGMCVVNGSIELQADVLSQANLVVDASECTLAGKGQLLLSDSLQNRVYGSLGTNRLVIGPDFTVRGSGQLGVGFMHLTNQGVVEADNSYVLIIALAEQTPNLNTGIIRAGANQTVRIVDSTIDSTGGIIESLGDGVLSLENSTVVGGTFQASEGSLMQLSDSTLIGGRVQDAPGRSPGVLANNGDCTLQDFTVDSQFNVMPGGAVRIRGTITVNGLLSLRQPGTPQGLLRVASEGATLAGSGSTRVGISVSSSGSIRGEAPTSQLVIAAGHTVRGVGDLGNETLLLVNDGTIRADGPSGSILRVETLPGTTFESTGLLDASTGNLVIQPNTGSGPTVASGDIAVAAGSFLSTKQDITQTAGTTRVQGAIHLGNSGSYVLDGGTFEGSGAIRYGDMWANGGVVSPGNPIGRLTMDLDYVQGPASTLRIDVGGTQPITQHDVLLASAVLSGTLELVFVNGFVPTPASSIRFIESNLHPPTGAFSRVVSPYPVTLSYTTDGVRATFVEVPPLIGDLNGDGTVNGADLGALLAVWGACTGQPCAADLNNDGTVSGSDLGILLTNWG